MSSKVYLNSILLNSHTDIDQLTDLIPELKQMVGCPHNHPAHCFDLWQHTVTVVGQVPSVLPLRLAALFHDTGKLHTRQTGGDGVDHFWGHEKVSARITAERLNEMGYEQEMIDVVCKLVSVHDLRIKPEGENVRRVVDELGRDLFEMMLALQRADLLAHSKDYAERKLPLLEEIMRIYKEEIALVKDTHNF